MKIAEYESFLENISTEIEGLRKRSVFLVTDLIKGGELDDPEYREYNATVFTGEQLVYTHALLVSDFLVSGSAPLLVDFPKAIELYVRAGAGSVSNAEKALKLSRINFLGTDGMRGRVGNNSSAKSVFAEYLEENLFSPGLVELMSAAFSRMLIAAGTASEGDQICVGNDGRDRAVGGLLVKAMHRGFNAGGMKVLDQGIMPSPFVPYQVLKRGLPGGAVLTASHNPSNQNGIKFFVGGNKLLPEGVVGEYSLSAWMYRCYRDKLQFPAAEYECLHSAGQEALEFMIDSLPHDLGVVLGDCRIVLDNANGAYEELAGKITEHFQLHSTTVNGRADGGNINEACGVAEIEGTDFFTAEDYTRSIAVVQRVFDIGRSEGNCWGIVLDGDGDRAFVLLYCGTDDRVYVLNGDRCGYLLAAYLEKTSDSTFVCTVESDLMTSYHAARTLGLRTETSSVGDKWIAAYPPESLLIGLEASGHIIMPLPLVDIHGKKKYLASGNGMLTALMTLYAVHAGNLTIPEIIEPFEPGFTYTAYTYLSDRSRFYRDSTVWKKDVKLIEDGLERLKQRDPGLKNSRIHFPEKEDAHMLYAVLETDGLVSAAVFCRNSGTEEKTAVYAQGPRRLADELRFIAERVSEYHQSVLKNTERQEYRWEQLLMSGLSLRGQLSIAELHEIIEQDTGSPAADSDLMALVYGMRKERRVVLDSGLIKPSATRSHE
ncbi:hypothetical protein [Spirochaeta dissipatitropha]